MKKKLAIGAVILALIAGVTFWALRGDDIKEKAVEKAVEAVVETVVKEAAEEARDKLIKEAVTKLIP